MTYEDVVANILVRLQDRIEAGEVIYAPGSAVAGQPVVAVWWSCGSPGGPMFAVGTGLHRRSYCADLHWILSFASE